MATRMSSRAFNQETSRAKKAAERGPVVITDRGRPAHVLLTYQAYEELLGTRRVIDLLGEPRGIEDVDLQRCDVQGPRPASVVRLMFLLDTDVVSELRKVRAGRADLGVASWAASVPSPRMFLSAITIHELEFGVLLAERADSAQGALLRRWLDGSVAPAFDQRVLPIDEVVARHAAALHVPDPAPYRDAFIGATALVHRLVLVTRNARDFERFPDLVVLNPWS